MDLGGSIRRRRASREGERPREPGRRRASSPPAWKLGSRYRRALKWRGWKPKRNRGPGGGRGRNREVKRGRRGVDGERRSATPLILLVLAATGAGIGYAVSTVWLFPSPVAPPDLQGVPDLRGRPIAGALALLADSGLSAARVDSIRHPAAPAGTVIGQDPLPGRTALPGAEVRVTMSAGPEIRLVPDVTRLPGSRAVATLEAGGFAVWVDTVQADLPAGRIIAMDPSPGTETRMPGTVRLEVSRGPPTFPMPSLLGYGENQARSLLAVLGLTVSSVERRYSILNVNRVFGQYPEPNADVAPGARVRLIVGRSIGWILSDQQSHAFPAGSGRGRRPGVR